MLELRKQISEREAEEVFGQVLGDLQAVPLPEGDAAPGAPPPPPPPLPADPVAAVVVVEPSRPKRRRGPNDTPPPTAPPPMRPFAFAAAGATAIAPNRVASADVDVSELESMLPADLFAYFPDLIDEASPKCSRLARPHRLTLPPHSITA